MNAMLDPSGDQVEFTDYLFARAIWRCAVQLTGGVGRSAPGPPVGSGSVGCRECADREGGLGGLGQVNGPYLARVAVHPVPRGDQ